MIVRCWGARGSIAVSGPQFVKYGGDTACMEVRSAEDDILIIDAGTGIRRLGNALIKEGRYEYSMLFTHSHWDHILGFPFFKPLHQEQTKISLFGCPMEQGNMQMLVAKTMAAPYFPVPYATIAAHIKYHPVCLEGGPLHLHSMEVHSIPLSHPNLGLGFKIKDLSRTFVFLTDNELMHTHKGGRSFDEYVEFSRGADLLIHDAEYTDEEYENKTRGWGHSTYKQALDLALKAKVKSFGLYHHNPDRHDAHLDAIVQECRDIIKERGVDMECFAVSQHMERRL